jgi:MFS superfamily sulfate permease-like transporter
VSGVVFFVLMTSTDYLRYVPKAVLGAVIEVAMISLMNFQAFVQAYKRCAPHPRRARG